MWYKVVNNKKIKISKKEAFSIIPTLNYKRLVGSNISIWFKDDINHPIIILIGNGHYGG